MNSLRKRRCEYEELFFSFKMQIATETDYQKYLNKKNNLNFLSNRYFNLLTGYFSNNYLNGIRDHAVIVLGESSKLLLEFDELYLIEKKPNILFEYISNPKTSEQQLLIFKHSREYLFVNKNNFTNFPIELLIYLCIISEIQTTKNNYSIKVAIKILKLIHTGLASEEKLLQLIETLHLKQLDKNLIVEKFFLIQDMTQRMEHLKYVYLFDFILEPLDEEIILNRLDLLFTPFNYDVKHDYNLDKFIPIFCEYFDTVKFKDNSLYLKLFMYLVNSLKDNLHIKYCLCLFRWLVFKVVKHKISLNNFEEKNLITITNLLELLFDNPSKILYDISEMFIQWANDNCKLIESYNYFKKWIKKLNVHLNSPTEIKFALFYFTLKSKIAKKTNISFEKLQSHEGKLNFSAYCPFISLNSRAIKHIKKQKQYLSLIENIEQNTININIDNLKGLNYIKNKIIYEDNLKFSIIDGDSTNILKNYFVSHAPKNDYVIFFLKILNTDIQQISKNYILKHQIIEEFKIKKKKWKICC